MRSVVLPAAFKLGNYALSRSTNVIMGHHLRRQYYSCIFRQAGILNVKHLSDGRPLIFQSF